MSRSGQRLVLALVLTAVAALSGWIVLSNGSEPSQTAPLDAESSPSPEDEIQSVLKTLNEGLIGAVTGRDAEQVAAFAMPGSPAEERARNSIDELSELNALDHGTYETLNVEVVRETSDEVVLVERNRISPCFRNAQGEDVTKGGAVTEQEIVWTLRKSGDQWRLYRARLRDQRVLIKGRDRCA